MFTKPSDRIGRISEEYSLLAIMSPENSKKIVSALSRLTLALPNELYVLHEGQLHVTITAILRDITFGEKTRGEFLNREASIIDGIEKVTQMFTPLNIHFNSIEDTQDAIIIKSPDSKDLNRLRTTLFKN